MTEGCRKNLYVRNWSQMYWIGTAGEYFRGLMIIINNMTVGSFLFPAKGAQFGSFKAREFKIIRTEKFLEVIYDIWLTLANFPVNDTPVIYRGGYWLFCPVSIPPSHGNIYYHFLWEATLPHHILVFDGAESTATEAPGEDTQPR